MRKIAPFVLLGFAAFLLAMCAMLKWYAYPTLAVAPADQNSVTTVVGEDMTYFSQADLEEKTGTLTTTIHTLGDPEAATDDRVVWDQSTITQTEDGKTIQATTVHVPFDASSGMAVDCCDATTTHETDSPEPTDFEGLVFKFPFNTQKQTYLWWDDNVQAGVPMKYAGTEALDGLTTYKFTQSVEPVKIADLKIPSRLLDKKAGSMVPVEQWSGTERTYWVEPETGALVKIIEHPHTTLRYNGVDEIIATDGDNMFSEDQLAKNIKDYKELGGQLHLLRVILPLVTLTVGLIALLAALVLILLRRRKETSNAAEPVAPPGSVPA